jgi:Protein of unknown function (DUF4038)
VAFTVTATPGGPSWQRGIDLKVFVLTNAAEAGGASSGAAVNGASVTPGGSLTPNFSNSLVAFALTADGITTMAAAAANNTYDYSPGGHTDTWCARHGHYTGTVTASSALTYGASSGTGDDHENHCAYEIPGISGSPSIDASSPAGVQTDTGTTNLATGSFTPPVGSVLVACVAAGGSGAGGGITCSITDTSGLGLVWTLRKTSSASDNFQVTFIFTATVPAVTALIPPVPPVFGPGRQSPQALGVFKGQYDPGQPPPPPPLPRTDPPPFATPPGMASPMAFGAPWRPKLPPPPFKPIAPRPTTLAGGGLGYFLDQYGNPVPYLQFVGWGLLNNAGRWSAAGGGSWQDDITSHLTKRKAQGYNCVRVHILGTVKTGGINENGDHWDGVHPFVTGTDPSSGLNDTYWKRLDYMLDEGDRLGITIEATATFTYDFGTGVLCNAWTTQQCTDWGFAIGTRYKNRSNLLWFFGDDYYSTLETQYGAVFTGLRNSGDTHPATIEYNAEGSTAFRGLDSTPTNATTKAWGTAHADYNLVYYYNPTYFGVEFAYQESGAAGPKPVIWGDGFYIGTAGNDAAGARIMRNMNWWALASGARGVSNGSDATKFWDASSDIAATTGEEWFRDWAATSLAIISKFPGWHLLVPDTGNVFVTAGRGTRVGYASTQWQATDATDYVCASITPDGSLAVLYFSQATYVGGGNVTATIDQTKLGAGYTATLVDPASGATSSVSTGSTYTPASWGNNADGFTDWVLVLQGPAAAGSGASAVAGLAAATGAAFAVGAAVTVAAGLAAGTGSAPGASALAAGSPAAGLAAGTGTAPAVTLAAAVAAGAATGTGSALAAALAASAAAGLAAGTGTAPAPAAGPAVSPHPGVAAGTGTAPGAVASTAAAGTANAGPATGTGTAPAPALAATVATAAAAGTGTAPGPAAAFAVAPAAGNAPATGTAPAAAALAAAAPAAGVASAVASVLAAHLAATVTAGLAAAAGAAPGPAAAPASAAAAGPGAGTGAAGQVSASTSSSTSAQAGPATAAGAANAAGLAASARLTLAAGTGAAGPAALAAGFAAGLAAAAGSAPGPGLVLHASPPVGLAAGAGAALAPILAASAAAGRANATGAALAAALALAAHPQVGAAIAAGSAPRAVAHGVSATVYGSARAVSVPVAGARPGSSSSSGRVGGGPVYRATAQGKG